MAWYHDKNRSTYVATYKDEKSLQRDVEDSSKYGWSPQNTAGVGGHINVGRTVTRAALTGGVGLLFGASRSKDKITVTFIRDQRWTARERVNDARAKVSQAEAKLHKSIAEISQSAEAVKKSIAVASSTAKDYEDSQKEVRKQLKSAIDRRRGAIGALSELKQAIRQMMDSENHARNAGADFSPFSRDTETWLGELDVQSNTHSAELDRLNKAAAPQDGAVDLAKQRDEVAKRVRKFEEKSKELSDKILKAIADAERSPNEKSEVRLRELRLESEKAALDLSSASAELELSAARHQEKISDCAEALNEPLNIAPVAIPTTAAREEPTTSTDAVPSFSDGEPTSALGETERAPASDVVTQIQRLAELHASGILTDDEFTTKKADLLSRM